MDLGRFGIWVLASDVSANAARVIESLGFGALWVGGSPTGKLAEVQAALDATESMVVATGIVNMWRDEATGAAAAYHQIQGRHPDRFLLGVGIGHPEATAEYRNPSATIVGYLDELDAAGVPRDHIVLAALGPRVLELAAARTAGAHPYLTTPRHTKMARTVIGDGPLLAPEQTVVVSDDRAEAQRFAGDFLARYLRLVNIRSNLLREGWSEDDLAGGGSDRLRDELILTGDATVAAGIEAHLDAGADHVAIQALGPHPEGAYRALAAVLYD
ncbi:MAG: TIGR03620 family F420-dependent LLM class oxidoreductase [Acidimicrobiia bacterium]